jgi:hypothetical protein
MRGFAGDQAHRATQQARSSPMRRRARSLRLSAYFGAICKLVDALRGRLIHRAPGDQSCSTPEAARTTGSSVPSGRTKGPSLPPGPS